MSIWTESYGGRYGPLTSEFFMQQTQGIQNGTVGKNATALTIDTLGLINAYLDPAEEAKSFPAFVNNNTYGIQTVPPEVQASMQQNLTKPGGCIDAINACWSSVDGPGAHDGASNLTSDQLCSQAFQLCEATVQLAYDKFSMRDDDDIAHSVLDSFPPEFAIGYLNRAWVQQALGAQVNFTINSAVALEAFVATGDLARDGALAATGRLLDAGVHVTMLSGDRDYQVNWFGGEQVSLKVNYTNAQQFRAAGYANMTGTNGTIGGMTRQAGNFSFTRVFQAGHSVPAYQPGIALDIFNRSIHHMDVATGKTSLGVGNGNGGNSSNNVVTTQGPTSIMNVTDAVPPMPPPVCYTWELARSCTPQQQKAVIAGTAMVKDFVVMDGTSSNGTSGSGSPGSGPGAQSAAKSGTGRNAASFGLAIALVFMVVSFA
jgi:carboxypeptidase C (cathepsin A)